MRRGFTLIELLVASGVFLFGFTAALGLFLIGTRARAQADGMLRLSLAASSIIEEIRLEAGREPASGTKPPYAPIDYVGDGFAAVATTDEALKGENAILFPYPPQPGIWYRVIHATDEKGDPADSLATALRVDLLVVWNPLPDPTLPAKELARRQRQTPPADDAATTTDEYLDFLANFMAKRGFAVRETAWIIRKPSWER